MWLIYQYSALFMYIYIYIMANYSYANGII